MNASDDETLADLLQRHRDAAAAHAAAPESDRGATLIALQKARNAAIEWIYGYFDRELRPVLRQIDSRTSDQTSVQYSVLVNEFFARVLAREDDPLLRLESKRELVRWASVCTANLLRDVLRRRRSTPLEHDSLVEFADGRAEHFRRKHGLDLEPALDELERWDGRAEPWPARATVLRHRYIDGLTYDEIAAQMGTEKKAAMRLKEAAIEALRERFGA
ncbi:ECF-type sigma factor [Engelhardtia mirabilis]|uniref:ECF sigma factor n=1 Tax=Engelhardtia mirabilis TaxID=2528011 RepID=A0A518BQQ4_9BACT|nr:ECF sigma factor [Planctomycetes bacterium Pla133]QDV03634.1 ECF sigma factor [Planctomycetes bacterium Pla86]